MVLGLIKIYENKQLNYIIKILVKLYKLYLNKERQLFKHIQQTVVYF